MPVPPATVQTEAFTLQRQTLARDDLRGLSGLTLAGDTTVWAIPEDQRRLSPLAFFDAPHLKADVPLRGIPEDWDTESIAWISGDRFALGTERDDDRDHDVVFLVEIKQNVASVQERIDVPYAPTGVEPTANHGIEGLCAVPPLLILANENVGDQAGQRFAPVASYHLETKALTHGRVLLTSETGCLSSIVCRRAGNSIEVIAIERHYGVGRLLTFIWPEKGGVIEPKVLIDLVPHYFPLPNYEGLIWRADGTIMVVADNDTGGVKGPNEVLVLTPRAKPTPTP